MKKKIVMLLTNGYYPDVRVQREARSLADNGFNILIVAWDREGDFRSIPATEEGQIKICRLFPRSRYGSGLIQIFALLAFYLKAFGLLYRMKMDVIYCHDFDTLLLGLLVKFVKRVSLVYDEHDFFSLYFKNRGGIGRAMGIAIDCLEMLALGFVDHHFVPTPKMQAHYVERGVITELITNAPAAKLESNGKTASAKLRIGYIGSVNYLEPLKALIDVSKSLGEQVETIISGRGVDSAAVAEYAKGVPNVRVSGEFEYSELQRMYDSIDMLFAFYPRNIGIYSLPNKFFEAVMTGTPMIVNGATEMGVLAGELGFGFTLDEKGIEKDFPNLLRQVISEPERLLKVKKKMAEIKDLYAWESSEARLLAVLDSDR